jgi:hypothetical protein
VKAGFETGKGRRVTGVSLNAIQMASNWQGAR